MGKRFIVTELVHIWAVDEEAHQIGKVGVLQAVPQRRLYEVEPAEVSLAFH